MSRSIIINHLIMILIISPLLFVLSTICEAEEKGKIYSVQVGAFKQLNNAQNMVDRIKKLGHQPFYRHETIEESGKFYVVYTGRYASREEAENGVKILSKSHIASAYLIKSWDMKEDVLEGAASRLVIREITYQLGKHGKEKVFIHANGKFSPIVFALEEGVPKSVVDIKDVDAFIKDQPKIPVNGELIKQIRTHLHQDSKTLRVVLDLSPDYTHYRVNQVFFESENVYRLEVEVDEKPGTKETEKTDDNGGQWVPPHVTGETKKPGIQLRRKSEDLAEGDVQVMLLQYNFYSSCFHYNGDFCNPDGDFDNLFIDNGDGTVTDVMTNLMWQKGGSPARVTWVGAGEYVAQLNRHDFAGYSDWRLPTLEELTSTMESSWGDRDLFIEPFFNQQQKNCWSSDTNGPERAWKANFQLGYIIDDSIGHKNSVRAVRSLPPVRSKAGH